MNNSTQKWHQGKIGDFLEVTNGKTNSDDSVVNGEYPLFDRSVEVKRSSKYLFDTEALIVPGEGKEFIPRYFNGKFDLHQRAYAIFPKTNSEISLKYLSYWMSYKRNYLIKMAVGSTVKSLRLYMLQDFPIDYPERKTQDEIAQKFSLLDDEITKTDQIIQKTEELKKGLMNELLTKGIGYKNFKKTTVGSIPEQWEVCKIREVAKISTGITPNRNKSEYFDNGTIPWVKSTEIQYNLIEDTEEHVSTQAVEDCHMKIIQPNAVLIAMYGQGVTRGKVAILNVEATTNQAIASMQVGDRIYNLFLYYYLEHSYERIRELGHGGNQLNLNTQILGEINIPLPQLTEQKQIAQILTSIDQKLTKEKSYRDRLLELKNGLMNDIFSRKVEMN